MFRLSFDVVGRRQVLCAGRFLESCVSLTQGNWWLDTGERIYSFLIEFPITVEKMSGLIKNCNKRYGIYF